MGEIKHKLAPSFLKQYHIGILPYKVNLFTKSINPLKVYEYVSSGLPVISQLQNVTRLGKSYPKINLYQASSDDNFINYIRYQKIINKIKNILIFFERKMLG